MQKWAAEPPSVEAVAIKVVDAPYFTGRVAKLVKHEVGKNSLDKAEKEQRFVKLA